MKLMLFAAFRGRFCARMRQLRPYALPAAFSAALLAPVWLLEAQHGLDEQHVIAYNDAPIRYATTDPHDPVAKLQAKLDHGGLKLKFDDRHGYLNAVLAALDVPVSSQTLVFSKTSFQFQKISPQRPRALYFNDNIYVGWVPEGNVIEVVSFDPMQGAVFYTLDQSQSDQPSFNRAQIECIQCHVVNATKGVPGVMLRSVHVTPAGALINSAGSFITTQASPLKERWGGWYVTGSHGQQVHMGNMVVHDRERPDDFDPREGANLPDLSRRMNAAPYLSDQSDIVAHLVLAHQAQMHNLITLTNYQARIAMAAKTPDPKKYEEPAEELVKYMLFTNEAPLEDEIKGPTEFAKEFAARGPRDSKGRSLRDFDLHTRIFKYPCSYLIYSESFDALPTPAKDYVYKRLLEVLTNRDQSPAFSRLTAADRKAILEILVATKSNLPEDWKRYRKP